MGFTCNLCGADTGQYENANLLCKECSPAICHRRNTLEGNIFLPDAKGRLYSIKITGVMNVTENLLGIIKDSIVTI